MSYQNIIRSIADFSAVFVSAVNQVMYPADKVETDKPEIEQLSIPLRTILDRYKIELYFLFSEDLIIYENNLTEGNFKELLAKLMSDLRADRYDCEILTWFCIIIAYYASVANKRNINTAHLLAANAINDTIKYYENDVEINDDIVKGIKETLVEMAQRIFNQKKSHETEENLEEH